MLCGLYRLLFWKLLRRGIIAPFSKNIGIAPDHYRKMRNGRVNIPQRTADYIILKASDGRFYMYGTSERNGFRARWSTLSMNAPV